MEKCDGFHQWIQVKYGRKKTKPFANAAIEAEKLQAGPLFKEVAGVYKEKVMEMKIGTYEP